MNTDTSDVVMDNTEYNRQVTWVRILNVGLIAMTVLLVTTLFIAIIYVIIYVALRLTLFKAVPWMPKWKMFWIFPDYKEQEGDTNWFRF